MNLEENMRISNFRPSKTTSSNRNVEGNKAENKKVCCRFNLNCLSKFERINKTPTKIVTNDEPIKL